MRERIEDWPIGSSGGQRDRNRGLRGGGGLKMHAPFDVTFTGSTPYEETGASATSTPPPLIRRWRTCVAIGIALGGAALVACGLDVVGTPTPSATTPGASADGGEPRDGASTPPGDDDA